jgi:hypothetical protein
MNRISTTLLVIGSLVCGAIASTTCYADDMDLCEDLGYIEQCEIDEMDLCADDDWAVTTTGTTVSTTVAMTTRTGSFSISVDATALQVKASIEKALGKLLFDQGVGSSSAEATEYVEAVVNPARRLSEFSRQLAVTQYLVTYTISVPSVVGTNMDTAINAIRTDPTILQAAMVTQFAAANVASATTVTIQNFVVNSLESDTDAASRLTGKFSTMFLLLLFGFASTQGV